MRDLLLELNTRTRAYEARKQRQEWWTCAGILAVMAISVALGWL